jgi:hypothetical protein
MEDLQKEIQASPEHFALTRGLQSTCSVFGQVVRLAKFWVDSHLLHGEFPERAIELIVAYQFTGVTGFQPVNDYLIGFLRFLHIISHFKWDSYALIVDIQQSFKPDDLARIQRDFELIRGNTNSGPAMFIATPQDPKSSMWTKTKPSKETLSRIINLARQSLQLVESNIFKHSAKFSSWSAWKVLFRTPISDFDVVIRLNPDAVPHSQQNKLYNSILDKLFPDSQIVQSRSEFSYTPVRVSSAGNKAAALLIGLNPVLRFVEDLQVRHSQAFFNKYYTILG